MKNKDANAFPMFVTHDNAGGFTCSGDFQGGEGLTKREYFSAKALQGLVANLDLTSPYLTKEIGVAVSAAVVCADRLLDTLEITQ